MSEKEMPEHVQSVMDCLPTLPSHLCGANAALWASTTLLHAALERGWPRDDLRSFQMTLACSFIDGITDEQLHGEFQLAIDQARAFRSAVQ